MSISLKEYYYVLMLEKWFFTDEKDLRKLAYMIDVQIPMEIENFKLAVALNSCGWIYDSGVRDENDVRIINMKKNIVELLQLEITEVS